MNGSGFPGFAEGAIKADTMPAKVTFAASNGSVANAVAIVGNDFTVDAAPGTIVNAGGVTYYWTAIG